MSSDELFSQKGVMPGETQMIGRDFYFVSLISLFLKNVKVYVSHKEVKNDSFFLPHPFYQFYHLLTKPDSASPPNSATSCVAVEVDLM